MKKQQHVVPRPGGWAVKGAGNSNYTAITSTQAEAIKIARDIAINQKAELKIHGRDGKIRDSDSYGNDPCPPKDRKY
jgi:hypothetical protein